MPRALRATANVLPMNRRWIVAALILAGFLGLAFFGLLRSSPDDPNTKGTISMEEDKYRWLEEIDSNLALAWVEEQNALTRARYESREGFTSIQRRIRAALDSNERIPFVSDCAGLLYNYWTDEKNPKGILRRTSWEEYAKDQPQWETVLDVDALAEAEGENWVYKGLSFLRPECNRGLLSLSRGGGDAIVTREYDIQNKQIFDDGFHVSEAKSDVSWAGKDRLLVATDFGEGSLSDSGYPISVRMWHRGETLADAETLFTGERSDVSVHAYASAVSGYQDIYVYRATDFYTQERFALRNDELKRINVPIDADISIRLNVLLISLQSDWTVGDENFKSGSLLVADLDEFLEGTGEVQLLFEPTESSAMSSFNFTANLLLLNTLDNVLTRNFIVEQNDEGWRLNELEGSNTVDSTSVYPVSSYDDDRVFFTREGFLRPTTLSVGEPGRNFRELKFEPPFFDASGIESEQRWATSADGTKIPYFVVRQPGSQTSPTLLYGYGGFRASMLPAYMKTAGIAWLERGGAYVLANIRGGGEFGPKWHQAALKENRHKAYDDFIAVAEDLVARGITTPRQLGIMGGSNGGLLMGNMLTRRPGLFGAIVAAVPLFDMRRYHELLAGASWMAEYGDPDNPEEWEFIKDFSPYHNLDEQTEYPPILITTSTRDDRVHPGHARKMAAKLIELGQRIHYYENTEGGHAGAADNSQRAFASTLEYEFLWDALAQSPD